MSIPRSEWTVRAARTSGGSTYGQLVDLVERYFAALDDGDMDTVLDSFTEDAIFTIQSAQSPHEGRDRGIRKMCEDYISSFKRIRHVHFRHVVDVENQRIASQFRSEQVALDGTETVLTSCNFFYVEDGRFSRVYVYMSDGVNVLR
ncbi:nuclear transport factor 2 family protein [Rhodococcus sp. T2V]|uniref:nuclear transport factor 2 family protein n=1 Tax=Rhodococcus sp. T2V TaxID=3034164 RepID=UPI0023E1E728|nr:nuclear transport factor 2 family protein [Rhodococcus sp. T2V]MDF3306433.1 nuclear transport factor 2 family protein [Rhodococcus sp. T2V]